jgi:hypothetical protein
VWNSTQLVARVCGVVLHCSESVELVAAWGDLDIHMSVRKRVLNGATVNGTQINLAASAVANGVEQPHRSAAHVPRKRKALPPSLLATACGLGVLLGLVYLCLAAPVILPHAFLLFAATALPWRMISFCRRKYTFFLADFCYVSEVA